MYSELPKILALFWIVQNIRRIISAGQYLVKSVCSARDLG